MDPTSIGSIAVAAVFVVDLVLLLGLVTLKTAHRRRADRHRVRRAAYVAALSRHLAGSAVEQFDERAADDDAFLDAVIDLRNIVTGTDVETLRGVVARLDVARRQVARLRSRFPLGRRLRAAVSLAEIGDESTAGVLIEHLDDDEPEIRIQCARGLGRMQHEAGIDAILARFGLEEPWVRARFADTLVAYGTSHIALAELARIRPGETLLVTGAAGGVGLTAVELGALMGARVLAVARGEAKRAAAEAAGAWETFDAGENIAALVKARGGADVVYETVGGALFDACLRAARPGARILPIGFAGGEVPAVPANRLLVKNQTVIGFYFGAWVRAHPAAARASLEALMAWHRMGRLRPLVSHVLPLEAANEGLGLLRDRAATGKVVVRIGYSAARQSATP